MKGRPKAIGSNQCCHVLIFQKNFQPWIQLFSRKLKELCFKESFLFDKSFGLVLDLFFTFSRLSFPILTKAKSSFGDVLWNPIVTIDWVRTSKILYIQVGGLYSLKVI